ncbi:ABC transporter permease subunit [Paenibacillus qinlingensis]|uniref:Aldouronate transport system permease protein n=1 Tax=Paenibacillus qinlingensis TaxID=1837343 RepID=A0ABU1P2W7_9BACL|nr:ABC transporter permease subunit [Paenibacillus qinlingensis]MDR6553894.1 putative aldouronate transport system permease protein [Paenibacillus qinlingensis]
MYKTEYSLRYFRRALPIYFMLLPGVLFFVIFKYVPMFGISIAFQEYNPFQGFWKSDWVGIEHFQRLFEEQQFLLLLKNTLLLNLLDIFVFFPAPILFAVLLNEVQLKWFKKSVQTIVYAPHFLSWVVIVGMTVLLFATQKGSINQQLAAWGFERIELMTDPVYFRLVWVLQNIWHGVGWSAIIFLAALAAVNPSLYEAAVVDGAGRLRQIWHITLPALRNVIVIVFIIRLGNFMDIGFEHIYLLQNPLNLSVSDVFDTYVYRNGIAKGEFSYSAAVGLFKSIVGLVMVIGANTIAKKMGQEGVY